MTGNSAYTKEWKRRLRAAALAAPRRLTKEEASCCVARRDEIGRLPVGFCSPECVRRPVTVTPTR